MPAPAAGQATDVTHRGEGKVESIGKEEITISHGPIASLQWGAMTMGFKLPADAKSFLDARYTMNGSSRAEFPPPLLRRSRIRPRGSLLSSSVMSPPLFPSCKVAGNATTSVVLARSAAMNSSSGTTLRRLRSRCQFATRLWAIRKSQAENGAPRNS